MASLHSGSERLSLRVKTWTHLERLGNLPNSQPSSGKGWVLAKEFHRNRSMIAIMWMTDRLEGDIGTRPTS